ncbi:MAG TPA: substrate-binding domain-containing protein [Enterovirga sp.]
MAQTSEIKVLSSLAIREAYLELVPEFEKASGHRVATTWTGTVDIRKRMAAGEIYDLVIMTRDGIEALTGEGKIVPGSGVDLVKVGIGIAVREGAAKPDVSSPAALKAALLAAKTIGYSTGPSGVYLQGLFERMGIGAQVKDKVRTVPSGEVIGDAIVRGDVEIGFQQISELVSFPGIAFLGPLPAEIQHISVFAGGIHTAAQNPAAAKALIAHLTSAAAVQVIRSHGLEPG